jgi:hypothetical protein
VARGLYCWFLNGGDDTCSLARTLATPEHAPAVDVVAGGDLPARLGRPARRVLAGGRVASDDDYRVRAYAAWLEWRLVPDVVVDDDMSGGSGDIAAAFGALRRIYRANRGRPRVNRRKSSHAGAVGTAAPSHSFCRRPDCVSTSPAVRDTTHSPPRVQIAPAARSICLPIKPTHVFLQRNCMTSSTRYADTERRSFYFAARRSRRYPRQRIHLKRILYQ